MKRALIFLAYAPSALTAGGVFDGADVVFLGEVHDNPGHHLRQAEIVADLEPSALVFEMLTQEQADLLTPELIADAAALETALNWAESGWPEFSMYYPIFAAAPDAEVYGAAVGRDTAQAVRQSGHVAVFRGDAAVFGLTQDLPEDQQVAREAMQFSAHCEALPKEMLPMMVDIQRLRDAELAYSAKQAFDAYGGPVAVITGNGHARRDWGAPVYLMAADPGLRVVALGQGENGASAPLGQFDLIEMSPPAKRDDPCDAFR